MNNDIYNLHHVVLDPNYIPNPIAHLENPRDNEHFIFTLKLIQENNCKTILDIGSYDGWLPLLLARQIPTKFFSTCEWVESLLAAGQKYAKLYDIKNYAAYHGDWLNIPIDFTGKWDLITCYEVLEHVPLDKIELFIKKMELYAKTIAISLPDQKHEDNKQHQWTPKEHLDVLFKNKKNLKIVYKKYVRFDLPCNWFITYDV